MIWYSNCKPNHEMNKIKILIRCLREKIQVRTVSELFLKTKWGKLTLNSWEYLFIVKSTHVLIGQKQNVNTDGPKKDWIKPNDVTYFSQFLCCVKIKYPAANVLQILRPFVFHFAADYKKWISIYNRCKFWFDKRINLQFNYCPQIWKLYQTHKIIEWQTNQDWLSCYLQNRNKTTTNK